MALELEDGTGKANAQSYVDAGTARTYAALRGIELSAEDSEVEVLLVNAMDYLEAQRARFQGTKLTTTQALQWPREEVYLDGAEEALDPAVLPQPLKDAQCQLCIEQHNGTELMAATTGIAVKRKKIGDIDTTYAINDGEVPVASMPKVDALLAPLCVGGTLEVMTVRA
jgi:hypothetical protein